ncbi:MAG: NupC/NupG family nucleoside CNT transporter [Bacteroidia bacterium]
MQKVGLFTIVILFIQVFFYSCKPEKPNFDAYLTRKWVLTNDSSQFIKFTVSNGIKRFEYNLNNKSSTGFWQVSKDSVLTLTYDLPDTEFSIDSSIYIIRDNKPAIVYFKEGKEITRIELNEIQAESKKDFFKINTFSEQELSISSERNSYIFTYQPNAEIQQSSFGVMSVLRGILGLLSLIVIAWLFSSNKKAIDWILVAKGIGIQVIFAILILKIDLIQNVFSVVSQFFVEILNFTREGSTFVFGGLVENVNSFGFIFAFQVLPTIIFFSALTSLLFYLGVIQKIVYAFAWIMKKTLRISGAESLAAAGNIFLGQTEAPLLIKPYISGMTRSELMCLMSGGMATIAGGVLAAYIGFLGGDDPAQQLFFAKHLLAASVMSAPAAIVAAKIIVPETEQINSNMEVSREKIGSNMLEAIANGTTEGLKLAVNVGAMLIVFIAFIALANYFMKDLLGELTGLNEIIAQKTNGQYNSLSLQFVLGYGLKPLAWLMGTSWQDSALVGQLLGEKTILNEFVAYVSLGKLKTAGIFAEQKSIIIATYILCGFSNFASIGIQIGGIGALAPEKRATLSQLGIKALIGGTLASLFTAVIVGMLI